MSGHINHKTTRKEIVVSILRTIGRPAIAEEVIAILDSDSSMPLADRVRIAKEVHGTLSTLFDEGKIRRSGLKINPATGAEVYAYEVETIARGPREKVSKGYKEKYEDLQKQFKEETERNEFLVQRNLRLIGENEGLKARLTAAGIRL